MLDKHKLALQLSTRKASSAVKSKKQATPEKQSTKLVVRNVAFEGTRKDVMSLFSPFGHMKSCRLPRKFDGTPRYACVRNLHFEHDIMHGSIHCVGSWALQLDFATV